MSADQCEGHYLMPLFIGTASAIEIPVHWIQHHALPTARRTTSAHAAVPWPRSGNQTLVGTTSIERTLPGGLAMSAAPAPTAFCGTWAALILSGSY